MTTASSPQPASMDRKAARKGQSIAIIGGGTAGWMTAAALSRFLDKGWGITLVESDAIGIIGVGEATIPMIQNFNRALGLDESTFVRSTQGSYKLGIEFVGWGAPDQRYIHGFGLVGRGLGLLPFQHYWAKAFAAGRAGPLSDYVFNNIACGAGKFAHVQHSPESALPPMPYAFHFDAGLYAKHLRSFAEARGVVRHEGRIEHVAQDAEKGDIASVTLDDGRAIAADFFIDCSGFHGLLLDKTLGTPWVDWSHWLPCDRALAVPCESVSPTTPYTRSSARQAGWQWRIPLQHRTGNGHVFCSSAMGEDEAAGVLLSNLDGKPLADPRLIKFQTGVRAEIWRNNVYAIGLSSGFLEPLESTSIHLIQTAIDRLLIYLTAGEPDAATRAHCNRAARREMESIRDFIILHYTANGRDGEAFWDQLRHMPLPDTLSDRIAMFRASARVVREADELFDVPGWVQVMIGQGIVPTGWSPLADQLSDEQLDGFLTTIRTGFTNDVARMPAHDDFIRAFAPAAQAFAA